mmetsp:Transcript_26006/g.39371  ORF Transcript_26006/g.39371 Transcript_26006/m.39371 type:complete len:130 (+) Transcript_26006:886-1275(+)
MNMNIPSWIEYQIMLKCGEGYWIRFEAETSFGNLRAIENCRAIKSSNVNVNCLVRKVLVQNLEIFFLEVDQPCHHSRLSRIYPTQLQTFPLEEWLHPCLVCYLIAISYVNSRFLFRPPNLLQAFEDRVC